MKKIQGKKVTISQYTVEDFMFVIPATEIESYMNLYLGKPEGKKEIKKFWDFMRGQTMQLLSEQGGVYTSDLQRYLDYRKKGMKNNFPLDD